MMPNGERLLKTLKEKGLKVVTFHSKGDVVLDCASSTASRRRCSERLGNAHSYSTARSQLL